MPMEPDILCVLLPNREGLKIRICPRDTKEFKELLGAYTPLRDSIHAINVLLEALFTSWPLPLTIFMTCFDRMRETNIISEYFKQDLHYNGTAHSAEVL
jgi:hypothetical protein